MSAATSSGRFAHANAAGVFRLGRESGCGVGGERSVQWLLKRNCSLAPRQLGVAYACLCVLSLLIAGFFWVQGATLVAPFAGVELLTLGVALLMYARHAADSESIRLQRGRLTVEQACGGHMSRVEFIPDWVRVQPEHDDRALIELSGQGRCVSVGRFVRSELRRRLAEELRWALRRWNPAMARETV